MRLCGTETSTETSTGRASLIDRSRTVPNSKSGKDRSVGEFSILTSGHIIATIVAIGKSVVQDRTEFFEQSAKECCAALRCSPPVLVSSPLEGRKRREQAIYNSRLSKDLLRCARKKSTPEGSAPRRGSRSEPARIGIVKKSEAANRGGLGGGKLVQRAAGAALVVGTKRPFSSVAAGTGRSCSRALGLPSQ